MLFFGPLSSVFDFLTFSVLILVFHAQGPLFQTGWFIESLATQVLIVFVIRTQRPFYKSRPSKWLVIASLGIVLTAIIIPFTPFAGPLGFIAPPPLFFVFLIIIVMLYLLLIEHMKNVFLKKYSL